MCFQNRSQGEAENPRSTPWGPFHRGTHGPETASPSAKELREREQGLTLLTWLIIGEEKEPGQFSHGGCGFGLASPGFPLWLSQLHAA